jgi:chaperone BCS1
MDVLQIAQVSLYSKLINDNVAHVLKNDGNILWIMVVFLLYQWFYTKLEKKLNAYLTTLFENKDETSIIIPQHKRYMSFYSGVVPRENVQIIYSKRFKALTYYISTYCETNVYNVIEIINRVQKSAWDDETIDFILLPQQNSKMLLHKDLNIYFEIQISEEEEVPDDKSKKQKTSKMTKNYVYKLSKPGKQHFHVLKQFMDTCIKEYEDKIINNKSQQIFEYLKSRRDSETNKCYLDFHAYPFKSNKFLDRNIFIEEKQDFIDYIDRFSNSIKEEDKKVHEERYADAGMPFKAGIILKGRPGCGKSSLIRGILNRTGRNGIVIRWSTIKTCNEFCSILRSTVINDVKYEMKDLCFIFEDFDANDNTVLKTRSEKSSENGDEDEDDDEDDTDALRTISKQSKKKIMTAMMNMEQMKEDELTLECVLNVIDGIIELHDAMMIFTTNHLEKIDPAFLRPGRIDYMLELKFASVQIIREMVTYKYRKENLEMSKYDTYFEQMRDEIISPAEVQVICLKYNETQIEECLAELVKKTGEPMKLE